MPAYNWWLIAGGAMSGVAACAHLCCIPGGAAWYRFFGAGERMARQVERGAAAPAVITFGIAAILASWSVLALSGAGVIPQLPFVDAGLVVITAIYLLRAAALPLMLTTMPDRGARFLVVSSAIVLVVGLAHAVGLYHRGGALLAYCGSTAELHRLVAPDSFDVPRRLTGEVHRR